MSFDKFIAERFLRCPVCGLEFRVTDDLHCLKCTGGRHSFDIAAGGYINLATDHSGGGDSKACVRARSAFLRKNYYAVAAEKIIQTVSRYVQNGGFVVDAGCGEGYYSNLLADRGYSVCGFDLSKFACDTAAKTAKGRAVYAVSSVYKLPLPNVCADAVINIFAPCVESEYMRVLRDGGKLIVVGAGERHLMGLKKILYDDPYINTVRCDLPTRLKSIENLHAAFDLCIAGKDDIEALFSMTPYYWRTSPQAAARLGAVEKLETEIDFEINVYEKNPERN